MRALLAATLLATAVLTGCTNAQQECEQAGGQWVKTGEERGTRIQYTRSIHECQGGTP